MKVYHVMYVYVNVANKCQPNVLKAQKMCMLYIHAIHTYLCAVQVNLVLCTVEVL